MAVKVTGKRIGSFTDRKTGEIINFGKLYVLYDDSTLSGLEGTIAETISVRPEVLNKIPVGAEVTLIYNKYGKVDDFVLKDA